MPRIEGGGVLTDIFVDGENWYRIYSDNWIEQGGRHDGLTADKALFIPMVSNRYQILLSRYANPTTTDSVNFYARSVTATGFNLYISGSTSRSIVWQASGRMGIQ